MQPAVNPSTVTNLTSAELRDYLQAHHERDYVLIDVRQSEEYMAGHIPGARLIPLNELEASTGELKQLAERQLIFYCRSGGRSARASAWASQILNRSSVFNLLGGFLGWEGLTLVDFPRLAPFDLEGPVEVLLWRALELEKGTHRLYEQLASEYKTGILADAISQLVSAELAHGRAIYQLLAQHSSVEVQDFDAAFAQLPSTIIENGMSFDTVVNLAREVGAIGEMALLELALEIELGAYDVYKNLATIVVSEQGKRIVLEIAEQEKGHANWLLRAIAKMASAIGYTAA